MQSQDNITIHSAQDFIYMRQAGELAAKVLDYIQEFIQVGVTTNHLNELCHQMIISNGAIPAPLNYKGFPKSICTSINHVICHGIPSDKKLEAGDIINIDVTVILNGWHGDTSRMFFVGKPSIKAKRLVDVTYSAMMMGIEVIKPGVKLNYIGKTIQQYIEKNGFSIVKDFCGHGVGKVFHMAPNVLHYYDKHDETVLMPGMFFTVEPMINAGGYESRILADGWTAVTKDKSLSAQFEHTVAVTEQGFEIFTISPKGLHKP